MYMLRTIYACLKNAYLRFVKLEKLPDSDAFVYQVHLNNLLHTTCDGPFHLSITINIYIYTYTHTYETSHIYLIILVPTADEVQLRGF